MKNQLEWKEEIKEKMDFKKLDNSHIKMYNLDDLVQKRKEELKHATSIRELYEQKLEKANNLYFELNTVLLQLDEREKELLKREKALNIHNNRIVRPIVKREFKNRAQTYIQRNSGTEKAERVMNNVTTQPAAEVNKENLSHSEFTKNAVNANNLKKFNADKNSNKNVREQGAKNKLFFRKNRSKSATCGETMSFDPALLETGSSVNLKKENNNNCKKLNKYKYTAAEKNKMLEKFVLKNFATKKPSLKDAVKSQNNKTKQQIHFVRKNSMKQKSYVKCQEKLRQVCKYMLQNMNEVLNHTIFNFK